MSSSLVQMWEKCDKKIINKFKKVIQINTCQSRVSIYKRKFKIKILPNTRTNKTGTTVLIEIKISNKFLKSLVFAYLYQSWFKADLRKRPCGKRQVVCPDKMKL